jgi:predicted permease
MFHWTDIRYALRLMRRSPMFTALTVIVLSGGLGLSIFTFSFLNTAMVKPLPLSAGDRIVRIEQTTPGASSSFDAADYAAMRGDLRAIGTVGAFAERSVVIGDERHERVLGAVATESNLFDVARVRPMLGRVLQRDDQATGAEPVIVLGHWVWQVVFGSDSSVIGRRVPLNGALTRVVGVMPAGFGFPVASDAWVPIGVAVLATTTPETQAVDLYARLADGVSTRRAATTVTALLSRARATHPGAGTRQQERASVSARSFPMAQIGDDGPMVFAVLNLLATLILALACINVLNLLLARANERARETAVRLALGASRGRLVIQSLWESVLLCIAGGVFATLLAAWGLGAINEWLQTHLARNLAFWWVWHLDRSAIVAAGVFVTIAMLVLGAVISVRAVNTEFNAVLRDGGARSGSRREGRTARRLVVAQVATVTVLMFFGVLSGVVAYRVANVDVGYPTARLLSADVAPPAESQSTHATRAAFYQIVNDGVSQSSAVERVLLRASLADIGDDDGGFALGTRDVITTASPHAYIQGVLGSLNVLGVSVRAGRDFDARDDDRNAPVALVSQAAADRYWPNRSPIGEQIRLAGADSGRTPRTIVGVVSDVLLGTPLSKNRSAVAVYLPLRQTSAPSATVIFKHRGDAAAAQSTLYRTLALADPRVVPPFVQTYDEILEKTSLIAASVTKLFAFCFGFALLLAVSGTYGLMARSIGQRTREIGVRRALGATDSGVTRLLLGQGARQLGVGILVALPPMIIVGIGFSKFFPIGAAVLAIAAVGVCGVIVGAVLLATAVPTRNALRIPVRDALAND